MSTSRRQSNEGSETELKMRVKELEKEVKNLKLRLDELRKAKNTTVVKREREVLQVGTPFGRRDSKTDSDQDVALKLKQKDKEWRQEMDDLKRKFEQEIEALKKENKTLNKSCDHEKELEFLRHRNEDLENDNSALVSQNHELKDRVDSLLSQLSVKEASWCEMEEKLKLELKQSWGEKYKAWMDVTEAKINDLQQTNALLRMYLKKQKPEGSDPTGQDPDFNNL